MADELRSRLESLIDSMDPIDKEVLALRHFEQLTPRETAQVLQIHEKAAGMRYIRALHRLKQLMADAFGESSPWLG
jgi:RNA polymerase sigma-70 factor (ECF subfamily)